MIQVEGLSKRYARHVAVNNISFSVEKGDVVGFLGPNGAGKTTTMRIVTGLHAALQRARRKRRRVRCLRSADRSEEAHRLLAGNAPVYPEMRVREYLRFVAGIKNVPVRAGNDAARVK